MITHKDPEIQFLITQLEQQRDQALGQSSALFKKVVEANKKIEELETKLKQENKDTIISMDKYKGEK